MGYSDFEMVAVLAAVYLLPVALHAAFVYLVTKTPALRVFSRALAVAVNASRARNTPPQLKPLWTLPAANDNVEG